MTREPFLTNAYNSYLCVKRTNPNCVEHSASLIPRCLKGGDRVPGNEARETESLGMRLIVSQMQYTHSPG